MRLMSDRNDKIVIFGASTGAIKVAKSIRDIGLNIEFFVDNDRSKQGSTIDGISVKNPSALLDNSSSYKIIIASIYHDEIKNQLLHLGIEPDNIILKEKYIQEYIDYNIDEFISEKKIITNKKAKENIVIDLSEGIKLGGLENWSLTLSRGLYTRKKQVAIFTLNSEESINAKEKVIYFNLSYEQYKTSVKELVDAIVTQLPCTIIINRINQTFMAAYIVKRLFKDQIKIISVIHSDFSRMYEQNALFQDYVDAILCVSNDVAQKCINSYGIDRKKVYYKDSPIIYEEGFQKSYSKDKEPIIIGYGARLEKAQKRADLLLPLIERLEELKVNYILHIAGRGGYFNTIQDHIRKHSLEQKVILYGAIPFDKMSNFWKRCDIFINLSDIEGIGLSMLEAMALGLVPIVTNTAGASSFITNGVNGYIHNIRDVEEIAKCIYVLSNNKDKLPVLGDNARNIIRERCNIEEYLDFIENLIEDL